MKVRGVRIARCRRGMIDCGREEERERREKEGGVVACLFVGDFDHFSLFYIYSLHFHHSQSWSI